METSEFVRLDSGAWIAKEVLQNDYCPEEGKESVTVARWTFTIREIELKPSIDEDKVFNTSPDSLPIGALLYDKIAGVEYLIGEECVRSYLPSADDTDSF